jgi:tagatose-6-phosphate ketose/aldose isomerase
MSDFLTLKTALAGTATHREILQQPEVWRSAARIVRERRTALDSFLAPLLAREDLRIVLTGAGTSAFVGQIAAPSLEAWLGRRVEAVATTDLVLRPDDHLQPDVPTLLISFARSGDSPESQASTELADRLVQEVSHLIVSCNPDGILNRTHESRSDSFVLLMPERSHDDGFAMTSSFTAMLLSVLLAFRGDDDAAVGELAAAAEQLLAQEERIAGLAATVPQRLVYLGGGPLSGLARESALKMLELTAGHVVPYYDSSLGFRHGPKAVLDAHTVAVVYRSADRYSRAYDEDIIRELRGAIGREKVLTVSAGQADAQTGTGGPDLDWVLEGLETLDDAYRATVYVIFAQLFALYCSAALGLSPDNPFPDGDVNRVVKGVTIHPLIVTPVPARTAELRR